MRSYKCEANTVGRKTWVTFKYTNLDVVEQQLHVIVDFQNTAPDSRAYYIDAGTEEVAKNYISWTDNSEGDFFGPLGEPRIEVDMIHIPPQGKVAIHGAMWQPKNTKDQGSPIAVFDAAGAVNIIKAIKTNRVLVTPPWPDQIITEP
jgi:hypothetical protein